MLPLPSAHYAESLALTQKQVPLKLQSLPIHLQLQQMLLQI